MPETTTITETRRPAGQGNPAWLTDMAQGKGVAHPRKSAAKPYVPPAGSIAAPPAPTQPEGTTAPAASAQPVQVQPVLTPEVPPVSVTTEPPALTPATENQPVAVQTAPTEPAVTEQPKTVVTVDDPNAVIRIQNSDGTFTEKSAATIKWEDGMRARTNRKDSELDLKSKQLEQRERDLLAREEALKNAPQPQQTVPQIMPDPEPVLPPMTDTNYEAELGKYIGWQIRNGIKPLTDALAHAQSSQDENARRNQAAAENFNHNIHLTNDVLPSMLPFDLDALAVSNPEAHAEALGRLKMAAQAEGIDLSTEGVRSFQGRLEPSTVRIIALSAFSDGWNPMLRKAAPAAPAPVKVDPVAAELSRKLASGEPLVPAGEPTQPLVPVAPSGSPAVSNPNRNQIGNSSATVPNWRNRLGSSKT